MPSRVSIPSYNRLNGRVKRCMTTVSNMQIPQAIKMLRSRTALLSLVVLRAVLIIPDNPVAEPSLCRLIVSLALAGCYLKTSN